MIEKCTADVPCVLINILQGTKLNRKLECSQLYEKIDSCGDHSWTPFGMRLENLYASHVGDPSKLAVCARLNPHVKSLNASSFTILNQFSPMGHN